MFVPSFILSAVRVQWAKSRARMQRFTEEVMLLTEEMKRVRRFMQWKAQNWQSKTDELLTAQSISDMHAEGLKAYAQRRSLFYLNLDKHFTQLWQPIPSYVGRMQEIIEDPDATLPGELKKKKRLGGGRKGNASVHGQVPMSISEKG